MFQIPTKDKEFIQVNKGDQYGNLYSTFNMDFDSALGKVRVSSRTKVGTDDTDDAQLELPLAFIRSAADGTDRWWALTADTSPGALFKTAGTTPTATFTQDAISDTPTTNLSAVSSDMVDFNGALIVSLSADLARLSTSWDASWWDTTLAQSALTSAIAHPLHVTKKSNYLLIGDGNLVHTVDKNSNVNASRIVLPDEFQVIWIRSNSEGAWIGARNKYGREAECFFWDESAENYNRSYKLNSSMTFAGVAKDNIVYTVNGEGQLLKYGGYNFVEVAVFPIYGQAGKLLQDSNTIIRSIHRNGMAVIENKIHILLNGAVNNTIAYSLENLPSGIWVYDEKCGLRHKYPISMYDGTENDYGQPYVANVGALASTDRANGLFLAGATIYTTDSATLTGTFYRDTDDSLMKRGHFVTSMFESSAFEDVFKDILLTFKNLRNSTDKIVVKYRTTKSKNYPIAAIGTWASTTTFTLTSVALGAIGNITAGDEVYVIRGKGAGTLANITSIVNNAGTYTVTIDEAIPNVGTGTMYFMVYDWIKAATVSTQGIERQGFDLDAFGTFIQLKVELKSYPGGTSFGGDSPELEGIKINNQPETLS